MYNHRKSGFTLIELMVVTVIIGVLTAIAIISYHGVRDRALASEAYLRCNAIGKSIQAMGADTGQWPGHTPIGRSCGDSETYDGGSNEIWNILTDSRCGLRENDPNNPYPNWAGPYLVECPKDPWGNDYFFDADYQIDGETHAVVGSFGPNGVGPNQYDDDDIYVVISSMN